MNNQNNIRPLAAFIRKKFHMGVVAPGKFRNDYYIDNRKNSINIEVINGKITEKDKLYDPINKTTRIFNKPYVLGYINKIPENSFAEIKSDFKNKLIEIHFKFTKVRLSCMYIEYSLFGGSKIDKLNVMLKQDNEEQKIHEFIATPLEIKKKEKILFAFDPNQPFLRPEQYPFVDTIIIKSNKKSSLVFRIYKIMLFEAERVNLLPNLLPCKKIQYEIKNINYSYFGGFSKTATINIRVKLFNPYDKLGVIGFAHFITLKYIISYFPIDIMSNALIGGGSLIGALFGMSLPSMLGMVTVIPILQNYCLLQFKFNFNKFIIKTNKRIYTVNVDIQNLLKQQIKKIIIQRCYINDDIVPLESNNWQTIKEINLEQCTINDLFYIYIENQQGNWFRVVTTEINGEKLDKPIPITPVKLSDIYYEETLQIAELDNVNIQRNFVNVVRQSFIFNDNTKQQFFSVEHKAIMNFMFKYSFYDYIYITQGDFTCKFYAKVDDSQNLYNTHILIRIWLQPDVAFDVNKPGTYKNIGELFFKNIDNKIIMQIGGVSGNLEDYFVSPPLTENMTLYELKKYVSEVIGDYVAKTKNYWQLNFINSKKFNIYVSFYAISILKPDIDFKNVKSNYVPIVTISVDDINDDSGIKTNMFVYSWKNSLSIPIQNCIYNSVSYVLLDTPLFISNKTYEGNLITKEYNEKINFIKPSKNVLNKLLTIVSTKDYFNPIEIPIVNLANEKMDENIYDYVDFCTNRNDLLYGMIDIGEWNIYINLQHSNNLDVVYKIEIFLITEDGKIKQNIYNKTNIKLSELTNIKFNISNAFQLSGYNLQLIIRMYFYPYKINKNTQVNKNKYYILLNSLEIQKHTIKVIRIDTTGVPPGKTINFYENLPSSTNKQIGDFIFESPNELTFFVDFSQGPANILGTLTSPIYNINLPLLPDSHLEYDVRIEGARKGEIAFKTDLEEPIDQIASLSAIEDVITSIITVACDMPDTNAIELNKALLNITKIAKLQHPYSSAEFIKMPSELINTSLDYMQKINKFSDEICYIGNDFENNVMGIIEYGGSQFINPITKLNTPILLNKNIKFLSTPQSNITKLTYILGIKDPGILIFNKLSLYETTQVINYIVECDPSDKKELEQNKVVSKNLNGYCHKHYPGITVTIKEHIIIAYVLQGKEYIINARISVNDGESFSDIIELFSFDKYNMTEEMNKFPKINNITLKYDRWTNVLFLFFTCGGKLFISQVDGHNSNNWLKINNIMLIGGSKDLSDNSIIFNVILNKMKEDGVLIIPNKYEDEDDLIPQRIGVTLNNRGYATGDISVYYKNINNEYVSKHIRYPYEISRQFVWHIEN